MWTYLSIMDPFKEDMRNGSASSLGRDFPTNYSTTDDNLTSWDADYILDSYDTFEVCVNTMNKFGMPVIIFGGIIGNCLSFIVFTSSHLRLQSCSVYLAFLNVVDTLFLLFLLTGWLGWFRIYLFHKHVWCQAIVYVSYVMSFLSAWGVVSFTIERYIVVYHPLKKLSLCTRYKAILTVVSLSVGALAFYSFTLFTNGIVDHPDYGYVCMTLDGYDSMLRTMTAVDTLITLLLPSLIIILLNIAIVVKVWDVMRMKTKNTRPLYSAREDMNVELNFRAGHSNSSQKNCPSQRRHPMVLLREHSNTEARRAMHLRTTRSLLVVSTVFVVLNLPSHSLRIHFVVHFLLHTDNLNTAYLQKWQQIFQFLSYMNYSANFLLYCACSRSFRTGLARLCNGLRRSLARSRKSLMNKVILPKTQSTR